MRSNGDNLHPLQKALASCAMLKEANAAHESALSAAASAAAEAEAAALKLREGLAAVEEQLRSHIPPQLLSFYMHTHSFVHYKLFDRHLQEICDVHI